MARQTRQALLSLTELTEVGQTFISRLPSYKVCSTVADTQQAPIGIDKLLIANRGEIACRVMHTAKRLGIPTVAVYSEADRHAKHVHLADQAFCIGPPAAKDSYLRKDRVLEVAKRAGATAVHPGYGFLSENAGFAQLCQDNGIAFVGPPASAITSMGDKSEAKALMVKAAVPVVPGYHGSDQATDRLMGEGAKVGFPVLVKAALGGGGKGMKLAMHQDELEDALSSAKREAAASFGDERILLERFIQRPRHIEVQIFADQLGSAVYLFERDCSVQRRHQKVIEEAPAPNISLEFRQSIGRVLSLQSFWAEHGASHVSPQVIEEAPAPNISLEFRQSIGQAAVAAGLAVGYQGAGTVEFIVDTDTSEYFFMEMNTRLQVEHPVTECITGQDLVEWQLRVAAGQALPLTQDQLHIQGHAFEARLYAESVANNFLPATGSVRRWQVPTNASFFDNSSTVRIDSGVSEGDAVGVNYDPMIAKVIARGPDRSTALARLHAALSDLQVSGLPTNQEFLKRLATHPAFIAAELDTSFIQKHHASLVDAQPVAQHVLALAAVADHLLQVQEVQKLGTSLPGAWSILDSKRINHALTKPGSLDHPASQTHLAFDLTVHGLQSFTVQAAGAEALSVTRAVLTGDVLTAELGDQLYRATLSTHSYLDEQVISMWLEGNCHEFRKAVPRKWSRLGAAAKVAGTVTSPMPGKIIQVLVQEGDTAEEGDAVVVLEAMKMEHTVRAPCAGTVTDLRCFVGAQVEDGHTLATIVPEAAAASA
ncbi:TPA: hypothetical protein ACH3X3_000393 [Trebouxia sp. C0006]